MSISMRIRTTATGIVVCALSAFVLPLPALAEPTPTPPEPTTSAVSTPSAENPSSSTPSATDRSSPTTQASTSATPTNSATSPQVSSAKQSPAITSVNPPPTVTIENVDKSLVIGQSATVSARTTAPDITDVVTQVRLGDSWSVSQRLTTVSDSGAFSLPLTYGRLAGGSFDYRIRVTTQHNDVYYSDEFTVTWQLTNPVLVTAPSSVTVDQMARISARVNNVPAGTRVTTQFLLSGKWSTSQATTTNATGDAQLNLTYGNAIVGTYTWRVTSTNAYGVTLTTPSYVLTRTRHTLGTIPAVWKACTISLQGVSVSIGRTEQSRIIVDQTSGSYASIGFYVRNRSQPCQFSQIYRQTGRIGSAGTKLPALRRAGDNSTPLGTYTITEAFGHAANPGTHMPYIRTTDYDYWVWDQSSQYFNTLRDRRMLGFNPAVSERVRAYAYYEYALVVNFNRSPVVAPARGGGIRFHLDNGKATGGCISVSLANLRTTVQLIDPGDKITIVQ